MKRMVEVYKNSSKELDYIGTFKMWGSDFEEFDSGPANYTVAIVEKNDGSIDMVYPKFIKFIDKCGMDKRQEAIFRHISNGLSLKSFLECEDEFGEAYDNGEFTSDMFYEAADNLFQRMM